MKSKHTPGLWESGLNVVYIATETGEIKRLIAICEGENEHANARLIAAAPDLLMSLKKLLRIGRAQLDQSATKDGIENADCLAFAARLIAKAEGGAND